MMVNFVDMVLYEGINGASTISVIIDEENETVWATQKTMAELFNKNVRTISDHLNRIFNSGELDREDSTFNPNDSVNHGNLIINPEAKSQPILYNLDVIISVGYRVNSKEATYFRKWATKLLNKYIRKGFVIDKELLKSNGSRYNKDYFDELLEIIREIRASERRVYQKITDIFAQCSYDYNSNSKIASEFYAKVQNKLHYAVTGHTAAEIIQKRANHNSENMGLTYWENSPNGKIIKSDIFTAKNYLYKDEIKELNFIVNMYLDYAENQARRHKLMSMQDWADKLDAFLLFNEYEMLNDKGKISMAQAKVKAELEYEQFRVIQDKNFKSDFDKLLEKNLIKNIEN